MNMRKVKLSATTTVDRSKEYFDKNNILIVPVPVIIDEKEYMDDRVSITPKFIYDSIREGKAVSTAANNVQFYLDAWKDTLDEGYDIVHIGISSGLSSDCSNAQMAAKMIEDEFGEPRVYVPDTLAATSGEALILDYIKDFVSEGRSAKEISDWVVENRLRVNHWFTLGDLSYLLKGGRITKAQYMVANTLNIYPVMWMDAEGKLAHRKKARGMKRALLTILETIEKLADNGLEYNEKIYISNSDCHEDAEFMRNMILDKFKKVKSVEIFDMIQIGCHTGPGCVSMYFWGKSRAE